MRLLITGGAGFIGSNFVHHIAEKYPDYSIVILDKLTYAGRKENLDDIKNRIDFIKGDITKRKDVENAMKGCTGVINFAAETHVDRSVLDPGNFIMTDIYGLYNLLETARKFDVERFVHISTDETYGHILDGSFKEEDALKPRNPYAASKAGADLLCGSYYETYNMPVMLTRSTNNFGPFQHPEKLIPKCIIYSIMGKKIPVYGKGENVRDWIFVKDNCEGIDTVFHKGKTGETYNIGGKQEIQNIQVIKTILKLMGKPENSIDFVKDRPGHDLRYSLNTTKIEKIGWKSKTSFEEGIKKTIEWYKHNESFWKPIIKKEEIDFHSSF